MSQVVAFVCAVSCWILVAVVQAVAYARLLFEHSEPTRFGDYISMSFSLQASLGAPAVTVQGRTARNLVTQHLVVVFIFNTVILAVLVAVLLANVGS